MKKITLITLMLLSFSFVAFSQEKTAGNIPTIDYCELVKNAGSYRGKVVNVKGIFMSGFEASVITGKGCMDSKVGTWAEWIGDKSCGDPKVDSILKIYDETLYQTSLAGIFRGKFLTAGAYGHLNAFDYQLEISCIQSASLLPEEMSGCKRINETMPFHYISYEKTEMGISTVYGSEKRPNKTEQIIWLRVTNNSSCPIVLPVDKKEPEVLSNESNVFVIYNVSSKVRDKYRTWVPKKGPAERLVSKTSQQLSTLPPGNSVFFSVPLSYINEGYSISIPFRFKDKNSDPDYDPFFFSGDKIPSTSVKK
jgi:hypothetical protein